MSGLELKLFLQNESRIERRRAEVERLLEGRSGEQMLTRGGRNSKPVKNLDTNEVFSSTRKAAEAMGINKGSISQAIYQRIRAGGYRWDYA